MARAPSAAAPSRRLGAPRPLPRRPERATGPVRNGPVSTRSDRLEHRAMCTARRPDGPAVRSTHKPAPQQYAMKNGRPGGAPAGARATRPAPLGRWRRRPVWLGRPGPARPGPARSHCPENRSAGIVAGPGRTRRRRSAEAGRQAPGGGSLLLCVCVCVCVCVRAPYPATRQTRRDPRLTCSMRVHTPRVSLGPLISQGLKERESGQGVSPLIGSADLPANKFIRINLYGFHLSFEPASKVAGWVSRPAAWSAEGLKAARSCRGPGPRRLGRAERDGLREMERGKRERE